MKIKNIGGELGLIKLFKENKLPKEVLLGIGDDCAVVKIGGKLVCITTDTLIDGNHFSTKYFSPNQIGMKAMESNVSDIASMGGMPRYALVSLNLRKDSTVEFVKGLYKGIKKVCKKYGVCLIGGDTTSGKEISITITLMGEVEKGYLCKRSEAKIGDFIFVSGDLGKSFAGMHLLQKGLKGKSVKDHLEPRSRLDFSKRFAKNINAMADVSDGLATDVRNICLMSNVGAVIYKDNIPVSESTVDAAQKVGKDPYDYALFGGEDFELVFTVSEKNLGKVPGYLVGEITKKKGVRIYQNGKESVLKRFGFDHFLTPI
ncbi:thiamine-phosphate kinase [Nanoarchaeota archaeon]